MSIVPEKIEVNTHNPYISSTPLSPITVLPNPLDQFLQWFSEAQSNPAVQDPEIVSLATSTPTGRPSIRVVLLKRVDSRGFVFFTNYNSRKANEIDGNPQAALSCPFLVLRPSQAPLLQSLPTKRAARWWAYLAFAERITKALIFIVITLMTQSFLIEM